MNEASVNPWVLIAEDDESIRRLLERALHAAAYETESATNGKEALDLAATTPRRFDLLLADVKMRFMRGDELAAYTRISQPELKVIFLTGDPDDLLQHKSSLTDVVLQKPVSIRHVIEMVNIVLGR